MNKKVSKLLREFCSETKLSYRAMKRAWNQLNSSEKCQAKHELARAIADLKRVTIDDPQQLETTESETR